VVTWGCLVLSCSAWDNDGSGIYTNDSRVRIEGNHVTSNAIGIEVESGGNLIIKNSATQNTTNYDISNGNHYGEIITSPGVITSCNPWANFAW
jgi:parallel beta-helix repeat protein